jgi:hypothetical protein
MNKAEVKAKIEELRKLARQNLESYTFGIITDEKQAKATFTNGKLWAYDTVLSLLEQLKEDAD